MTGTSRVRRPFSSESLSDWPNGIESEENGRMLVVAYCRVSTEEQAAEGFSITGQADKLRAYAELHDLGSVTVIEDPGYSGKNLERPGLQKLLAMVEAGHVEHVLIWKLDRLSRNLGDLIVMAEEFGKAGVGLHSFSERIDLSSATGRMFYNILGAFAQFYREQLAENVRMGMQQAAREGRWTNRPKTGYSLVSGKLMANEDAPRVRLIFRLRSEGLSYQQIEARTGIKVSTVRAILLSRVYLGEVLLSGQWYQGQHEALVTPGEWAAAHRGFHRGRRRSHHPLSGRVRCGLCGRVASIHYSPEGLPYYRCRHRGEGCRQPARSARGLERAALLGMRLLREDEKLQEAIRRQLVGGHPEGGPRKRRRVGSGIAELEARRRKLLELYYRDQIGGDLFAEEDQRISRGIETLASEEAGQQDAKGLRADLAERFDEVARILRDMEVERIWTEATEQERRVLVEELVDRLAIFPDHLEVTIAGAPKLNVLLSEVGLREKVQNVGVGGGI